MSRCRFETYFFLFWLVWGPHGRRPTLGRQCCSGIFFHIGNFGSEYTGCPFFSRLGRTFFLFVRVSTTAGFIMFLRLSRRSSLCSDVRGRSTQSPLSRDRRLSTVQHFTTIRKQCLGTANIARVLFVRCSNRDAAHERCLVRGGGRRRWFTLSHEQKFFGYRRRFRQNAVFVPGRGFAGDTAWSTAWWLPFPPPPPETPQPVYYLLSKKALVSQGLP
jgi:hypothetical protein